MDARKLKLEESLENEMQYVNQQAKETVTYTHLETLDGTRWLSDVIMNVYAYCPKNYSPYIDSNIIFYDSTREKSNAYKGLEVQSNGKGKFKKY